MSIIVVVNDGALTPFNRACPGCHKDMSACGCNGGPATRCEHCKGQHGEGIQLCEGRAENDIGCDCEEYDSWCLYCDYSLEDCECLD